MAESTRLQVRFVVTPAMLFGAQRAVARRVRWVNVSGYFIAFAFPVAMIAIPVAYGATLIDTFRENAALIIGLPLLWLVGVPLLQRWSAGRALRTTPGMQGEHVYSFTPEGIEIRSTVATAQLAWSAFLRAAETRDFVLLFQNKVMAQFIPKAAFTGDAELARFRGMVSAALGHRAEWTGPVHQP